MTTPLKVFVAMPGTMVGKHTNWTAAEAIKKHLYLAIGTMLESRLSRKVEVQVEKDRQKAGSIHFTMYSEAINADVYIADLTGANPNVYLELGVRWSMRDNVTILTSQHPSYVLFNAEGGYRYTLYGKDPSELEAAKEEVVNTIVNGLEDPDHVDSLVLQGRDLVVVSRSGQRRMEEQLEQLRRVRGDDLFNAAMQADRLSDRVTLLEKVLHPDVNPARADAHGEIGKAYWKMRDYTKAISHLDKATRLDPDSARWWRELGIAQSKHHDLHAAIRSLTEAVTKDPDDGDAHASLGGAYRRQARETGDRSLLQKARAAYQEAARINKNDSTYAQANIARLDIWLAEDDESRNKAIADFRKLHSLAVWVTAESPGQWALLDLAETWAFLGDTGKAVEAGLAGIDASDPAERASTADSALEPVRDTLAVGWLPDDISEALRALAVEYEKVSAT
ncbi:tetratricopeptide repeat protein [Lentzea sp. BCCO 10_0856]|uniref:Tetratricopeptide repeat protein n=1 Tax=Lentzea miocenica TaxID=3095431 RepID=A0ABU4TBD4_9PSEU|nr:tetratricopeptide repeat protein [Lentzea sp. BCCO 10_0856]MDX8035475.1 tetratricopeptide repeat protein [Lentzea sp. BCCO 10_0856]